MFDLTLRYRECGAAREALPFGQLGAVGASAPQTVVRKDRIAGAHLAADENVSTARGYRFGFEPVVDCQGEEASTSLDAIGVAFDPPAFAVDQFAFRPHDALDRLQIARFDGRYIVANDSDLAFLLPVHGAGVARFLKCALTVRK